MKKGAYLPAAAGAATPAEGLIFRLQKAGEKRDVHLADLA